MGPKRQTVTAVLVEAVVPCVVEVDSSFEARVFLRHQYLEELLVVGIRFFVGRKQIDIQMRFGRCFGHFYVDY